MVRTAIQFTYQMTLPSQLASCSLTSESVSVTGNFEVMLLPETYKLLSNIYPMQVSVRNSVALQKTGMVNAAEAMRLDLRLRMSR
jgi:hypothetical protein